MAVLSDRHFLLVDVQEHRDRSHIYYIESAPLGRLRAVITRADGRGAGGFTLDFAGPVFEGRTGYGSGMQIQYEEREGWASEDVSAFLAAIVAARR